MVFLQQLIASWALGTVLVEIFFATMLSCRARVHSLHLNNHQPVITVIEIFCYLQIVHFDLKTL